MLLQASRFARLGLLLLVLVLGFGLIRDTAGQTDRSGTTDESIRNVLLLVGNHQLRTIADPTGNYATVYTLAAAQSSTNRPTGVTWEYGWAVTLYGLLQVKNVTGATNLETFVLNHNVILARYYSWLMSVKTSVTNATAGEINSFLTSGFYNPTLATFFILDRLDYCGSATASLLEGAMFHAATFTNEHALMAQTTANWIAGGGQARTNGVLWRPERNFTIWADDLYMSCPFLIRWYRHTGNTNHLEDAIWQVTNFAGYLQDTNTGIWYHGFGVNSNAVNGYKWGRANGWALVTQAELLTVLPTNHPARSNLLSIFTRHVEGLKTVQAPSGMWRQVLDEPSLWEETSCTAMFAYAMARGVNRGWLDFTNMAVARKAFAAVCKNISPTGVISNICVGTSIGYDLNFYATRGRANDDHRGVGAVMLAGAEILLNPKLNLSVSNQQAAVSWNAGIADGALEISTNLTDWTNDPSLLTLNSNWQQVAAHSIVEDSFFRLRLPQPGALPVPLEFEAENLSFTTNGATVSLSSSDTNASGNYFITFNGDGLGDYIEFTVTNVPAGSYRFKLAFKAGSNRARMNLAVDGSPLGNTLDQYWPAAFYPLADFGVATFAATGDHTIRLATISKNGASSGYTLTADRFILAPE
jgi:unsaturated rhamnogalacturonyl hydrolase